MFAAGIVDAEISASAAIKSGKVQHVVHIPYGQTGTVVANTVYLGIINKANARVLDFEASITEAIATGADRTVTLDLQKSTGAGAFATILSSALAFNNGDTLRAVKTAAISSADLVDGDQLRFTVTVAGAAGAQAQGLNVALHLREDPQ